MKNGYPNFRYYDDLPKISGYEHFEDTLDRILKIEDYFEYMKILAEEIRGAC